MLLPITVRSRIQTNPEGFKNSILMRPQTHWMLKDKPNMRDTLAWQAQFIALVQSLKWPEQNIIYCIWGMLRLEASTRATVTFIQIYHRELLLFCIKVSILSIHAASLTPGCTILFFLVCLLVGSKLKGREWREHSNSPKDWRQNENLILPMLHLSLE